MTRDEVRLWATLILLVGGVALTFARRWNNNDRDAGVGVAGWTVFLIFSIWFDFLK